MRRPLRLTTVLMLLVAFLATGLLPAAGSWSCPDGTVCVYTRGRGYHCLGDRCQMAARGRACCGAKRLSHCCGCCGHGAGPGVAPSTRSQEHVMGEPARCRFHQVRQVEIAWIRGQAAPVFQWHAVADLPALVESPAVDIRWERQTPIRGSPPSSPSVPSSSPRAPPAPYCA